MAARVNRAIFWLHPLAWWLERTVTMTAEQACDEAAAQTIGAARRYAEILLAMADLARRSGKRIAWQGVAVYDGSQLSTRIDRLLSDEACTQTSTLKKFAVTVACVCGIALAVACRQDVAATPLRPDPEVSRRLGAQDAATKRFNAARDMTQAQADALEQRIAANPADFETRQQLVTYYQASRTVAWDKKVLGLRRHALWLIEHAPEHEVRAPVLVAKYDPQGYAAAKKLWESHLAKPDASPFLILRAAEFFSRSDPAYAEQLILRGQRLDPDSKALAAKVGPGVGGYEWPAMLANLYASRLTGAPDGGTPAATVDAFAIHVRQTLDRSTDAAQLASVGGLIVWFTPWSRDRAGYQDVRALGLAYLRRALELDPANVYAKMSLVRARLAEQTTDIDREARRADETFVHAEDITEYARKDAAKAKQQRDEAKGYADHVLAIAANHPNDPAYSAAVMTAHHVLAALALRDGDRELAVRHLQDSVKVPTSEQIQYAPPMSWLRPVNRLLKLGERERVADFLEKSASLTVVERERLLNDAKAIREGRMTSSYQWTTRPATVNVERE
jgi:tetratricopeptide (TPR) repeat protein